MNKARIGIITGIIFGAITVVAAGTVLAVQITTHHGSVTIPSPPSPSPTYTFKAYDALSGGNEITNGDSAFFAFGSVSANGTAQKTIYLEKTGTGAVTVTPAATWTGTALGTITFNPTSINLTDATPQPIVVTFTAGATPGSSTFDITYTGNP